MKNFAVLMFADRPDEFIPYAYVEVIGEAIGTDKMESKSFRGLVPPVTIEDLNTKVDFDDRCYLNDELKEMFFKLDLIQSYGSGVRRAKKAMENNKSPRPVYSPDNDTDDYTQVVAYINEEFARIQEEENRQAGSGKTAGKEGLISDDERSFERSRL